MDSPAARADAAFRVLMAIRQAEQRDRDLSHNPFWTMLKQDSFERFNIEFEQV